MGSVPNQDCPPIVVPVGQHPALDRETVDQVVMGRWLVGMAVDEGGGAVGANELIGGQRVQIRGRPLSVLLVLFALLA